MDAKLWLGDASENPDTSMRFRAVERQSPQQHVTQRDTMPAECATGGSTRTRPFATRWPEATCGRRSAMREVAPGDVVFSFVDTRIAAIGLAQSYCWESPKPTEFGTTGDYWEDVGWRVRVQFTRLNRQVRPKDHIDLLRPLLPPKYSPLQASRDGLQSVYLAEVPAPMAQVLAGLIGPEAQAMIGAVTATAPTQVPDDLDVWEQRIEAVVPNDENTVIIRARRGT